MLLLEVFWLEISCHAKHFPFYWKLGTHTKKKQTKLDHLSVVSSQKSSCIISFASCEGFRGFPWHGQIMGHHYLGRSQAVFLNCKTWEYCDARGCNFPEHQLLKAICFASHHSYFYGATKLILTVQTSMNI